MNKLAMAIRLAAKLREESFDKEKAAELTKGCAARGFGSDYDSCYSLGLYQACDKAAEQVGFDMGGTDPVYLLLKNSWNDALAWANKYKGE